MVAAAAERFGAGFRALQADVAPGPNLEARARAGALRGAAAGRAHRSHRRRPGRDGAASTSVRGAGLDGLAGMRPEGHARCSACAGARPRALCAAEGLVPVADPSNADPAFRRNRVRHELLPLLDGHRPTRRRRRRSPARPRCSGPTPTCSTAWPPPSTPPTRGALAAAPVALARRAVRSWLTTAAASGAPPAGRGRRRAGALGRAGRGAGHRGAGIGRVDAPRAARSRSMPATVVPMVERRSDRRYRSMKADDPNLGPVVVTEEELRGAHRRARQGDHRRLRGSGAPARRRAQGRVHVHERPGPRRSTCPSSSTSWPCRRTAAPPRRAASSAS